MMHGHIATAWLVRNKTLNSHAVKPIHRCEDLERMLLSKGADLQFVRYVGGTHVSWMMLSTRGSLGTSRASGYQHADFETIAART